MKVIYSAVVIALLGIAAHGEQPNVSPGSELTITTGVIVTGDLVAPRPSGALQKAIGEVEKQIDARHDAERAKTALDPFWTASFWQSPLWKLVPLPAGPQRVQEDAFMTPAYLQHETQLLDRGVRMDARRSLFGN